MLPEAPPTKANGGSEHAAQPATDGGGCAHSHFTGAAISAATEFFVLGGPLAIKVHIATAKSHRSPYGSASLRHGLCSRLGPGSPFPAQGASTSARKARGGQGACGAPEPRIGRNGLSRRETEGIGATPEYNKSCVQKPLAGRPTGCGLQDDRRKLYSIEFVCKHHDTVFEGNR